MAKNDALKWFTCIASEANHLAGMDNAVHLSKLDKFLAIRWQTAYLRQYHLFVDFRESQCISVFDG